MFHSPEYAAMYSQQVLDSYMVGLRPLISRRMPFSTILMKSCPSFS